MSRSLALLTAASAGAPGIVLYLWGETGLTQYIGLVILAFGLAAGAVSASARGARGMVWAPFVLGSAVLILSQGYVTYIVALPLAFALNHGVVVFVFALMLSELAIFWGKAQKTEIEISKRLEAAGYDSEELSLEVGRFISSVSSYALVALLGTVGLYLLLTILPAIPLDSITGLLLAAILYVIVVRYFVRHRRLEG